MKRSIDLSLIGRPVVAFEDHYPAGFIDPPHSHGRSQLSFALSGLQTLITDDATFIVPPNRAVWIPAGKRHEAACRCDVTFQVVYVDPSFDTLPQTCRVFEVSPLLRGLIDEIASFPSTGEMGERESMITQLLLMEIRLMPDLELKAQMPADPRLRRVCEAILSDPADARGVDGWAKIANMGRRTFTRSFKRQTSMSFATWQRQVRAMEGASRVVAGEPIGSVAFEVGYESQSAFATMFHRTFGVPPSEYRDQLRSARLK